MKGPFVVAVLVLGWAAVYMIGCAVWPWVNCPRCHGGGRKRSPSGKAFRDCRRCKGTGRRVRLGRRIWDWYRRTS